jgi:hypothetical protein
MNFTSRIINNLWKKDGLLRALMLSNDPTCNRHMDMKFNLLEMAKTSEALTNAGKDVTDRVNRPYGGPEKRTFSRVIHATTFNAFHNNYDNFVLFIMRSIHGRPNEASWAGVPCETLKQNLKNIYEQMRWLLLNTSNSLPLNVDQNQVDYMNTMLNGNFANIKPAIITDQLQYYLVDRIWCKQ